MLPKGIRPLFVHDAIDGLDPNGIIGSGRIWTPESERYSRRQMLSTGMAAIIGAAVAPWICSGQDAEQSGFEDGKSTSATCPTSPSASATNGATQTYIGVVDAQRFVGQSRWTDGGTPRTICRLDFEITKSSGDISAQTYNAYIFKNLGVGPFSLDLTGGGPLGSQAASAGVAGSNSWAATFVEFDFLTPFTTTASQNYALVVSNGVTDASNYAKSFLNATDVLPGYVEKFSNVGLAANGSGTLDWNIKIYWL